MPTSQGKIAKEYVLPTLSAERKKENSQQVTVCVNHWAIID
jgi:anti-sigma-K factor RskA